MIRPRGAPCRHCGQPITTDPHPRARTRYCCTRPACVLDRQRSHCLKWRAANLEHARERSRAYARAHPDRMAQWVRENPEAVKRIRARSQKKYRLTEAGQRARARARAKHVAKTRARTAAHTPTL